MWPGQVKLDRWWRLSCGVGDALRTEDVEVIEAFDVERLLAAAERRLRRALVARYGVELGNEATADAIAYAWEHRQQLATMGNPVGYLFRVGQTAVRRQLRQRRVVDLPDEAVLDEVGHIERSARSLPEALALLTPDQRVAVVLVHAHGTSYADAAAVMDIPVTTLRNHVHRGMRRLRQHLEAHDAG